ncbi:LuxR family transcriptional regulator [Leucobacter luti]|uniref:helix-turn-helix transcriptional regulator n=1 Tax=Leucobacter luti TaxID=340320 RepID=UPI00104AD69D|nr:helix-turn-helix transcriptional regulator [Leucobacter luti]MCW2289455.1 DNA-binding CsgD family transcriptional regulator [Leucobacter luti]TCK40014.1 LuxR family transcriptional regulator [Leucobacter luti]
MTNTHALASEAIDIVLAGAPQRVTRLELGAILRRMFGADIFVSYVNDGTGPYADPVELNMGAGRLEEYDRHFRYVDRLTPQLYSAGTAVAVTVDRAGGDEFVADFLRPQDMRHGLNYFPRSGGSGGIDLRLWRGRRARAFTEAEAESFRAFGDLLARVLPKQPKPGSAALTPRELQIAELIAHGEGDKQIAQQLGISLPTLRTHLGHAFEKTGSANRVSLAGYYFRHHQ